MLALGGFAERAHLGPLLFFVFAWSTLVYDPIAYWTWNTNGWGNMLGNLDFAGGTPVHISSGTAALAISFFLKKRRGYGTAALAYVPHNTTYVVLGTVFLWFGWFGMNNKRFIFRAYLILDRVQWRFCAWCLDASSTSLHRH